MNHAESFRAPVAGPSSYAPLLAPQSNAVMSTFGISIAPLSAVLARMLDEIDYGLVLVTATGRMRYANQLALRTLSQGGNLRLAEGVVSALQPTHQANLRTALADAARGLRRMLSLGASELGSTEQRETIAIVPMTPGDAPPCVDTDAHALDDREPLVMMLFGKQPASETLTLDFFARTHRLTGAESSVLHGLCAGRRPKEIAKDVGVAISTVRTQIGSIRIKTQTRSIRDLVNRVATLPPITPAMKSQACH